MRTGAFLLGGLVGMAAAVYLSRSNRGKLMMAGLSTAGSSMGKMWGQTKTMIGDRPFRGKSEDAHHRDEMHETKHEAAHSSAGHVTGASSKQSSSHDSGSMDEVQAIIDKDPALKKQVSEILSQTRREKSTSHTAAH